ncbi:hypothetical protein ACHAWF_011277 [Thalassiosira exigua]
MDFSNLVQQEKIDLCNEDLRGADLNVLTRVLRKSKVLETLDLCGNSMALAEGQFLDALAQNQSLRILHLGHNKIGDEGAKRLAKALKDNNTLETMFLHCNEIDDEGAKSLADALGISTSLEVIHLGCNRIGDAGAHHLAESLIENKTLRIIWIYKNRIGDKGGRSFLDALESNDSVEELDLRENKSISNSVLGRILAILRDPNRKALTSKSDTQDVPESTQEKASNGGGPRDPRQIGGNKHKVGSEVPIPGRSKKQKKSKLNDASNGDDAAGRAAVAVKREENEAEDLDAATEDEDQGAEPLYVTYEDVRPLYDQVKAKSSSANEKEFYGHIRVFLEDNGRHVLVSEFNLIQELMGKFESLLQDQAQSADEGEARFCESFLVGIIEQCKTKLQLHQHRGLVRSCVE